MSKIQISLAAEIIKKHPEVTPATLREIVEEMNEATAPAADEDIKPPAPKKQFVIILADAADILPKKDLTGWVVQIPEDASPFSTMDRVFKGAYDFNASKKGRMLPVKSIGESLESVSAKYFKESELWIKTKLPVAVVVTDNILPRDEFKTERVDRRRSDDEIPAVNPKEILAARVDDGEKTEVYRRDGKVFVETSENGQGICKSCFNTEAEAMEAFNGD